MPEPKPQPHPAADLIAAAELSYDAKSKIRPDATPSGFMRELVGAGLLADAVRYLAQAVGPARAIAWSLACLKELRAESFPDSAPAVAIFEAWMSDPSDGNRRAAAEAAEEGPERSLGLAIFFSGGSIAPPDVNPVPPPPYLAGKLAAGAIMLAVVGEQPENAADRYRRCIEIALKS
jgi:hypothetical protein